MAIVVVTTIELCCMRGDVGVSFDGRSFVKDGTEFVVVDVGVRDIVGVSYFVYANMAGATRFAVEATRGHSCSDLVIDGAKILEPAS